MFDFNVKLQKLSFWQIISKIKLLFSNCNQTEKKILQNKKSNFIIILIPKPLKNMERLLICKLLICKCK